MKPAQLKHYDHIVCGGGLVGALWALYLRRRSYSVAVFQSYWDLRKQVISQGRSINLILSRRAIQALDKVGIKTQVLQHSSIIKGRTIHTPQNQTHFLPYSPFQNQVNYCIERNKLNQILLSIAQNNNVDLYFRHALQEADFNKNVYRFVTDNDYVEYSGSYLYGADGVSSKVRDCVNREAGGSEETHWFEAEYKELHSYKRIKMEVHLWPRGDHCMMGQPNLNGTFSLTLILPTQGPITFSTTDQQKITKFLQQNFPDVYSMIPNATYQFIQNPVGYFGSLYTRPQNLGGKAVLLGDAAHTMVPFFWQSVNFAFNDCVVLDSCIEKHGFGAKAFDQYSRIQKPNGDTVANLSIKNYDKLANPKRILQKRIQAKLCEVFPNLCCTKNQATFYREHTYAQISQLTEKNDKILQELSKNIKSIQQLDLKLAQRLITGHK